MYVCIKKEKENIIFFTIFCYKIIHFSIISINVNVMLDNLVLTGEFFFVSFKLYVSKKKTS